MGRLISSQELFSGRRKAVLLYKTKINMKEILLVLALALGMFSINSCGGEKKDTVKTETKIDKNGPEYTSKYICPMYCKGSGAGQMGTCPVCKMNYERNEDFNAVEGSDHGHDHGDHEGHSH